METRNSSPVEIKVTWGLAWGLFWRMGAFYLGITGIVYLIVTAVGG